ncbi:HNH endonuclease signature motif containing protein [Dialister invisus]|uniref:HNH endonuclease signature motif containing protein n=1 Tax=Dialister invisus TaxID=218538 RepID=UPI003C6C9F64
MPSKPMRPCRHPGCHTLTRNKYCDAHASDANICFRHNDSSKMYGYRWRVESKQFLADHPMCSSPECHETATEVDHKIPHKGSKKLFWDKSNWQGLCHRCHSRKTATEDGGFGNKSSYHPHP